MPNVHRISKVSLRTTGLRTTVQEKGHKNVATSNVGSIYIKRTGIRFLSS